MSGLLGIGLSLALLVWLAFRGVSLLLIAPACALLAVLFSPGEPLLAHLTQVFMPALGGFVVAYFPLFLLGAVFGGLMEASGAADAISRAIVRSLGAEQALAAVVLACAVLTYGGVSLFVVAFAVYPIAVSLFRQACLPKRLIPATIALGAFTFTMTALPGTPAIQNAIPMPYFGTTPFAAPGLGLVAAAVMLGLGLGWLYWRARQAGQRGEGYGQHESEPAALAAPIIVTHHAVMPLSWALAPIAVVIGLNYLLSVHYWPAADTHYLASPRWGATHVQAVRGIWSVMGGLLAGIAGLLLVWQWHQRRTGGPDIDPVPVMGEGAAASVLPLMNTASLVGFGAVVAGLSAFGMLRDAVLGLVPDQPLVSLSVAVSALAGVTGSASGGMTIALQSLGHEWIAAAMRAGVPPELMHRVVTIATGGLDALPHNGAVITLLGICKLTHRDSYFDIFMVAVVGPLVALGAVLVLSAVWGSF